MLNLAVNGSFSKYILSIGLFKIFRAGFGAFSTLKFIVKAQINVIYVSK